MSKRGKSKAMGVLFLPLIALAVFTLFFLGSIATSIPKRAEEIFGVPDPELNSRKLYYQSLLLVWNAEKLTTPTNLQGGMKTFQVDPGDPASNIINRLQKEGLIDNPNLLKTYLVYSGIDKKIRAGDFILSPAMTEIEIVQAFENPNPQNISLTIFPGWRTEEIAGVLPKLGIDISPEVFIQEVKTRGREGRLFPGTYQVDRDITTALLVDTLATAFEDHYTEEIQQGIREQGLSPAEGLTLASIVEREAVLEEEMPLIASVFLNRLRKGMTLGADPTIQYALGYNESQETWWTNPLTMEDFQVDSPYNTYQNPGLPPGPICNPSLSALKAVAHPEISPYFFFSAACDNSGRHNFSETFEEHQQNICP